MACVVKSADTEEGKRFVSAVSKVLGRSAGLVESLRSLGLSECMKHVAFDCEGVDLSRVGTVELLSISFSQSETYLVDLNGTPCKEIVGALKELLESEKVLKIIHDCRMDSDALWHHHSIKLVDIHDTSCFHEVITGSQNSGLNDVLTYNGIGANTQRDKSVYKYNPRFWASRPLTQRMIEWASADVDKLLLLAEKQLSAVSESKKVEAVKKSEAFATSTLKMNVCTGLRVRNPGRFIGKGGTNIRACEKSTGTLMYQQSATKTWFVFYNSSSSLEQVKRKMAM